MAKTSALPLETVVKTSAPPTPEVTAAGTLLPPLTAAFNDVARSSLPPVTLGFALFHFFLAVAYGVFLPPEIIPTVVPLVGGTAVLLLLLYGLVRTWGLPAHWAQPMGAGIAAVSVCSVLIHLSISMEPRQTGIITFLLVGISVFLLSLRWLGVVLGGTVLGWLLVVYRWPVSPSLIYYGILLILSLGLSLIVFYTRRQSVVRYELLRWEDGQRRAQLQRRARQMETSMSLGQHITAILDLDTLLQTVAELIMAQYGLYYVAIYLLDPQAEGYLVRQAGVGGNVTGHKRSQMRIRVGREGLVGWVAGNGRHLLINDVLQDSRYIPHDLVSQTRSELDLPLRAGRRLIGVLSLQSDETAAFHHEDIPFLQSLADQAAIAIDNASLYQGERSARSLAETMHKMGRALTGTLEWNEVLELILGQLAELVAYDRGSVFIRNGEQLELVAARGFPEAVQPSQIRISLENESIFKEIYQTKRPLFIPDVLQWPDWQQIETLPLARAWLGVPLLHGTEVVGMLSLTRETTAPFTQEMIDLATTFAAQAAVGLENARRFDKTTRFSQQLEYEVAQRTQAIQEAYARLEQLDRAKSDFIAIASHELRTPLTILRGYSQMLFQQNSVQQDEQIEKLAAGIQSGAMRLAEVVSSMLEVAKIDNRALQLYPKMMSLSQLFGRLADSFADSLMQRQLTLKIANIDNLPTIEADPDALEKVFYHLLVNAIKYTPDGGIIHISGVVHYANGQRSQADKVEILVRDSGIGIDPEMHELIFSKFYQTGEVSLHSSAKTKFKGGGPGLGLAITRGIVEAHGGKIWLESAGHDEANCPGTTFHVLLPLAKQDVGELAS
ncbi:MAG: GAF domain-containing protein [Ardenticatenaceae bacterium]|nr:GAF domain-containing protein [Anaerolineales bacterium]MCB8941494.1 GAF domain-containing protein [Ardenticatenaceae bacterium]MCB8974612.1 GAF domain-containing protein [Ardenticatenaceae bacterium]